MFFMREEEIDVYLFLVTGLPYPVGICVSFVGLILFILFSSFFVFVFSVPVKVLRVTPLLSGVFVHRAMCAYFLRIERVVGNA